MLMMKISLEYRMWIRPDEHYYIKNSSLNALSNDSLNASVKNGIPQILNLSARVEK